MLAMRIPTVFLRAGNRGGCKGLVWQVGEEQREEASPTASPAEEGGPASPTASPAVLTTASRISSLSIVATVTGLNSPTATSAAEGSEESGAEPPPLLVEAAGATAAAAGLPGRGSQDIQRWHWVGQSLSHYSQGSLAGWRQTTRTWETPPPRGGTPGRQCWCLGQQCSRIGTPPFLCTRTHHSAWHSSCSFGIFPPPSPPHDIHYPPGLLLSATKRA